MPAGVKVTTSDDIFIELNGKRIAGVQSYSTRFQNDTKQHEEFGNDKPFGYSKGTKQHTLDLSRAYLEDTAIADGINFYTLSETDFMLVIVKNGKRIVYTGCTISDISEDGSLKDKVVEKISVMAIDRIEE